MGVETHRLLLLSLVAMPACTEKEGQQEAPDADLIEACAQYYGHEYACSEAMPEQDAEESCREEQDYFDGFSDACQAALAEYWTCLSAVDCEVLNEFFGSSEVCLDVRRRGLERCPLLFSYCDVSTGASGASPCSEGWSGCVDGKTYDLVCTDQEDSMACECQIDGVMQSSFEVEGSCAETGIAFDLLDRCDFPEQL